MDKRIKRALRQRGVRRSNENIDLVIKGAEQARSSGQVPFIDFTGWSDMVDLAELDALLDIPAAAFFEYGAEVTEVFKRNPLWNPERKPTPEAERFFAAKPKYVATKTYTIVGTDGDLKDRVGTELANMEAGTGALVHVHLRNSSGKQTISLMPWNAQHICTFTPGPDVILQYRESPEHDWEVETTTKEEMKRLIAEQEERAPSSHTPSGFSVH